MEHNLKKIVLIIEDEESYQKILLNKINKEGFKVILAKNGKEGLELAFLHHPDLIILDILMPIMNGLEMLQKLRSDEWGKKAKVIIVSAFGDSDKISHAVDLGTFDFFVKSEVHIDELISKIKEKTK